MRDKARALSPLLVYGMKKLIYVRLSADKKRVVLGVGDGDEVNRYSVSPGLFEELEISRGDELSEAVFFEINEADTRYRATKKALSLLSISDVSERSLVLKLRRAGYPRELSESVASEMVGRGYIDEKRQLSRLVLREANEKLRGRGRIVPALIAKGYSSRAVCEVLDELVEIGEISFSDNARRLCEKLLPGDCSADELKKLLYKYGYGGVSIDD